MSLDAEPHRQLTLLLVKSPIQGQTFDVPDILNQPETVNIGPQVGHFINTRLKCTSMSKQKGHVWMNEQYVF